MKRIVLMLALAAIAACEGTTEPVPQLRKEDLHDTWVLESINGQPLPYRYVHSLTPHFSCDIEVREGTLLLLSGLATRVVTKGRQYHRAPDSCTGILGVESWPISYSHGGGPFYHDGSITWVLGGTELMFTFYLRGGGVRMMAARLEGDAIVLDADWPAISVPHQLRYVRSQ